MSEWSVITELLSGAVAAYNDVRVPLWRLGVVVVLCAADGALAGLSQFHQSCCPQETEAMTAAFRQG